MNEKEYTILKQFTRSFIDLSMSQGKELRPEDIDTYINQAVMLSKLDCDVSTMTRLFIDMEYEYKIVHNKGQAIFNNYDEKREWYSNMEIRDNFFWSRYKDYLINQKIVFRSVEQPKTIRNIQT